MSINIIVAGVWLHESGVLAASPDGLITTPPQLPVVHYQTKLAPFFRPHIIEVKCPYTARDMMIDVYVTSKTHDCFLGNLMIFVCYDHYNLIW